MEVGMLFGPRTTVSRKTISVNVTTTPPSRVRTGRRRAGLIGRAPRLKNRPRRARPGWIRLADRRARDRLMSQHEARAGAAEHAERERHARPAGVEDRERPAISQRGPAVWRHDLEPYVLP